MLKLWIDLIWVGIKFNKKILTAINEPKKYFQAVSFLFQPGKDVCYRKRTQQLKFHNIYKGKPGGGNVMFVCLYQKSVCKLYRTEVCTECIYNTL